MTKRWVSWLTRFLAPALDRDGRPGVMARHWRQLMNAQTSLVLLGVTSAPAAVSARRKRVRAPATRGAGSSEDDCCRAAKLVYVLDENGKLSSYQRDTFAFVDIVQLQRDPGE